MSYRYSTGSVRYGDIYFEDDREGDPTYIDFGQDSITLRPSGSQILYAQADAVGIGTTTPDYTLDVAGDIGVNQYIYHNGDGNTWINFTDNRIRLNAGGNNFIDCEDPGSAPHKVRINNGGNNIDFVIKDNSNNVYFTADASTSRIGIGTDTPDHTLTVTGDISASIHISASAFYGDGSRLTGISGGGGGSSNITNMTHHRYNDGSGTGLEYIPWAGTSEQPNPSWISQGIAAYTGKLVKVLVRSSKSGGMGNTVVGIHIGTDGNTAFNSSAQETVTVNMTSANTTGVFNFTNANHFAAGDVIAVSIDPTNAHGNVNVTCVWEYQST